MKNFHSNIFSDSAYGMPWWRQLIWSILFVAMATTATCGNLIVIWIVMSHRRMRTVTNYFIGKKSHFLSNFQTCCIDLYEFLNMCGILILNSGISIQFRINSLNKRNEYRKKKLEWIRVSSWMQIFCSLTNLRLFRGKIHLEKFIDVS